MNNEILDRFWSKVDKKGPNDCWNWLASKVHGYGRIRCGGKHERAHRLSWVIHNGYIPPGTMYGTTCVLHRCDNPSCVNPNHLFLGDHSDNMRDMISKGRDKYVKGEAQYFAKMTKNKVRLMRNWHRDSRIPQRKLAKIFGISQASVWAIVNYKSWKHI